MKSVCAVIVTYNPCLDRLLSSITKLSAQLDGVVVVDNASQTPPPGALLDNHGFKFTELLELTENIGLAAGQNRGVLIALSRDFTHVLLLDQDSIPYAGMVKSLLAAESALIKKNKKVAVIGPQCIDSRSGLALPFCQISALGVKKINSTNDSGGDNYCDVDFIISSGSLIRRSVLSEVGLFCEGLFIDNVDIEWCYRASSLGFKCFGVFDAKLDHRLGDRVAQILGGLKLVHVHEPERLYFIMRNRISLYRKNHIPLRWKLNDFPRMLAKFILFSLLVNPRLKNCTAMIKGCYRGIIT